MPYFTQVGIEEEMSQCFDGLASGVEDLRTLSELSARAEAAYKVAYAKALLRARAGHDGKSPPMPVCEAMADIDADLPFLTLRVAQAKERTQREILSTLRSRLDGLRSICATLRQLT